MMRANRFKSSISGAVAVEWAIIAAPLFAFLFCICEVGLDWYAQISLDRTTQAVARQIMTGAVQAKTVNGSQLSASQFQSTVVCPELPSFLNCANLIVNVQTFSEGVNPSGFYALLNSNQTGLQQPSLTGQAEYCLGAGGAFVLLQLLYPLPTFTDVFSGLPLTTYNGTRVLILNSAATFRNEPFPPGTYSIPSGC